MAWEDISSTEYVSSCGDSAGHTASEMLDGTDEWWHILNEVHNLVIDLGSSKLVTKIKTKSDGVFGSIPNDIDIFVSDDTGDFGTAVETGIDISGDSTSAWTERILTTQSTGRYIKIQINSTTHGSNFLGWGNAAQKVLDFFTGTIPKRWYSVINLTAKVETTTSTSFAPTDGSLTMLEWDGTKYSNIIAAYFEVNGKSIGSEPHTWSCELYNRTNTIQIANVGGTGAVIVRGNDIASSLPSSVATLDVRILASSGDTASVKSARLIIVQEEDTTNKMRVYLPVGQFFGIRGTTYRSGSGELFGADCEHQYKWITNNFNSIENTYFHANIKTSTAPNVASVKLDSVDEDDSISELTTGSANPDLLISSDISSSLTDTTLYTTYVKNEDGRSTTTCYNAWLVVDLNPLTKFEFTYDVCSFGKRESTNTGWQTSTDYQLTYNTGDIWCYDCDSETTTHAVVSGHSGATNIITAVYDDGTRDTGSEQTETSSGANYNEDDAISTILNDSTIKAGWNVNSLPFLAYGNLWMHNLLVQIDTGFTAGTNFQLNISDTWKSVDAMQINIGDVWKSVSSASVNIGDNWKTIF